MRLAYMPDTHFGRYEQEIPGYREVAQAADHLLTEAETAERVGFDGIWAAREARSDRDLFPFNGRPCHGHSRPDDPRPDCHHRHPAHLSSSGPSRRATGHD